MKKINKKDLCILGILFLISLLICYPYVTGHYATDTYNIENRGYTEYATINSLNDGRIFMYLIGLFADFINIPIQIYVIILTIFGILISCITVMVIDKIVLKIRPIVHKWEEIIIILICYSIIFNFMYLENLYFVEATVMAMSLLLYVLSVKMLLANKKNCFVKSAILAILATFCYQGTIAFYLVFAFTFFLLTYRKEPKKVISYTAIVLGFCFLSFIVNVLQIKLVGNLLEMKQARMVGIQEIVENLVEVLSNFGNIVIKTVWIESCGLFLPYLMIVYFVFFCIMVIIRSIKEKNGYPIISMFAISLLTLIASMGMCIISYGSYDTGRIHMETGSLIGLVALWGMIEILGTEECYEKGQSRKDFYFIIWCFLIGSYTILNMINYGILSQEHKKVNKLEEEYCKVIEEKIKEHEEKYHVKVTNVVGIKQFSKTKCYFEEIRTKNVLTYDGLRCTWSYAGTINHYTGRKLRQVTATSVHRERFFEIFGRNPEREDMICIEDTLYIPIYL